MIYLDDYKETNFFLCIRLLNPLRIIIIFPSLQKTLNNFLKALLAIYKIFLSLFGLMLFYSLFGLYLFYGLEDNRCRISEFPAQNQTEYPLIMDFFPSLCGNWQCIQGY